MADRNFDMTAEEANRLAQAMKDPEFRKLLKEYADEISDPENLRLREKELAMMEAESNGAVELILPKPGFCYRTKGSKGKTFVNIAQNEKVEPAKGTRSPSTKGGKEVGVSWSIPYSLAHPRSDKDSSGELCTVYDFVVAPQTIGMIEKDARFQQLLIDTSLEAIDKAFKDKLEKDTSIMKKMKYKGVPVSAVFRRDPSKENPVDRMEENMKRMSLDGQAHQESKEQSAPQKSSAGAKSSPLAAQKTTEGPAVPLFSITHRGEIDLQDFTNARYHQGSSRPKELVVQFQLPLLNSSAGLNVDIEGRKLVLEKLPEYRVETKLPFEVNSEDGSAKFDKNKRVLVLTLPVIPMPQIQVEEMPGAVSEYLHLDRHGGILSEKNFADDGKQEKSRGNGEPDSLAENDAATGFESDSDTFLENEYKAPEESAPPQALAPIQIPSSEPVEENLEGEDTQASLSPDHGFVPVFVAEHEAEEPPAEAHGRDSISIGLGHAHVQPPYDFKQLLPTLSVVIRVPGIQPNIITSLKGLRFEIFFEARGDEGRVQPYGLVLNLEDEISDFRTDVSDQNLVIVLTKKTAKLWVLSGWENNLTEPHPNRGTIEETDEDEPPKPQTIELRSITGECVQFANSAALDLEEDDE